MKHGESHLYKNVTHVSLKENDMSHGEVLAAVNKNPETSKFPPKSPSYYKSSFTQYRFSRLSLNRKNKVDGYKT
jgi:hypothetical protein